LRSLHHLHSAKVGLALSGGSVRGLAHIGVYKALTEAGIFPSVIAGASAGSVVGAGIAAGMSWQDLTELARAIFWPKLLHGNTLERFCTRHLPQRFCDLRLPFAAIATAVPARKAVPLTTGRLASALNASCAMRVIRGRVHRDGQAFKDGGIACVLPADICRHMGAEFVIASDVWEVSSILRSAGLPATHPKAQHVYPEHYRSSLQNTNLLIHPYIPWAGYWPGDFGIDRMIAAGEQATHRALERFSRSKTYMPDGNVSAGSPLPHSEVRSSGSTARV
jgi:NTE family protein